MHFPDEYSLVVTTGLLVDRSLITESITAGKHLVLVTDPEIVEDAYAFDNPCFKDATPTTVGRVTEGPSSTVLGDTPAKDSTRWTTPWTSLGLGSAIRSEKRRTLDDSCVGVSHIPFSFFSRYFFADTCRSLLHAYYHSIINII